MGDGATSRRHHPNPAEAEWRWRGGGARRAGVKSAEPWVSRSAKTPHCFVPCSTKIVSQNQPLETAASKPVESPKSVSGDWLPTPEIARNCANSRVSQESKLETGLVAWGTWIRTKIHGVRVRCSTVPGRRFMTSFCDAVWFRKLVRGRIPCSRSIIPCSHQRAQHLARRQAAPATPRLLQTADEIAPH